MGQVPVGHGAVVDFGSVAMSWTGAWPIGEAMPSGDLVGMLGDWESPPKVDLQHPLRWGSEAFAIPVGRSGAGSLATMGYHTSQQTSLYLHQREYRMMFISVPTRLLHYLNPI